jgi:23S rRNA (guanine2445-N2)-methyltransferase / 23S rRNA (guanine2069-N7)-methyltransferase
VTQREIFFVTCAPGLERILYGEVKALRFAKAEQQVGGVLFHGTLEDAWRANLWLRTAVRVLMRVSRFEARSADALYAGAGEVDWSRFLAADGQFVVDAQTKESGIDHSLFAAQRIKDAVADQFREKHGVRPSVDKEEPDLAIHAHLFRDRCTLLVDTSGGSLHKRGWRRFQGRAPLAETLAAAIVLDSGWDRRAPLLDPFCGSGTILIEAALIASGTPPGAFRERFGFERWKNHDASRWRAAREEALRTPSFPRKLVLQGSDVDGQTITGAMENVESAGLAERVQLEVASLSNFRPKRGWNAWVVTNPPYGERIGDERDLVRLYGEFGRILRERCAGFHASILSGNPRLDRELGLRPARTLACKNGALECRLLHFEIEATAME